LIVLSPTLLLHPDDNDDYNNGRETHTDV
jgi:hypothetical protein